MNMLNDMILPARGRVGLATIRKFWLAPLAMLLALIISGGVAWGAPTASDSSQEVIATVDGKVIRRGDLNSPKLAKAREEAFQLEQEMLANLAIDQLRAKRPKEFPFPSITVTEDDIKTVYERAKLEKRGPLEAFEDQIRDFIVSERTAAHDRELFAKAVSKGYVKSNLQPPPPFRYRVAFAERKSAMGSPNAPIHLVEWSDFQ